MPPAKVLIIEDEAKLADIVRDYLVAEGHHCMVEYSGANALSRFRSFEPDLLILDWMLPQRSGLDICKEVRSLSDIPVLMLTARADEQDRVDGLNSGADDYICKPFSPRELVARVHANLRRQQRQPQANLPPNSTTGPAMATPESAHGLVINEARHRACWNGSELKLTQVEFRLLATLSGHPGRVYSRDQLINHCYSDYRDISDRAIDSHIKNLRKKLKFSDAGSIASVYGVGYRYNKPEPD